MEKEDVENEGFDFDSAVDDESKDELYQAKEEFESQNNELANLIIKEARRLGGNESVVKDKFAHDISGKNGAQSGKGRDTDMSSDRTLDSRMNDIVERIGVFQNMSNSEIEKLKQNLINEPIGVMDGLRKYYVTDVQPILKRRHDTLKEQLSRVNNDKIAVFMYVTPKGRDSEDGAFKEEEKLLSVDLNNRPGFEIYNGQVVYQMRPDQTPFAAPSDLFEDKKEKKNENKLKM